MVRKVRAWIFLLILLSMTACVLQYEPPRISGPIPLPPKWTPTQSTMVGALSSTPTPGPTGVYPHATRTPYVPEKVAKEPTPLFWNLQFTDDPSQLEMWGPFQSGIRQIYAIWDYANMREGYKVRREWFHEGALWLVREEAWDFSRFGANGTMTEISIYDFDNGLTPGAYRLNVYVNGEIAIDNEGFDIRGFPVDPQLSPDGTREALVKYPDTLVIQNGYNIRKEINVGGEIAGIAWLPDSKHVVYSICDRSVEHTLQFEMWNVNVDTGESVKVGGYGEDLRFPYPSPDGRYLAVIAGSLWGDACYFDGSLMILELDNRYRRVATYDLSEFTGLNLDFNYHEGSIHPRKPIWLDRDLLSVELIPVCIQDFTPGLYSLDLSTLHAEKLADVQP